MRGRRSGLKAIMPAGLPWSSPTETSGVVAHPPRQVNASRLRKEQSSEGERTTSTSSRTVPTVSESREPRSRERFGLGLSMDTVGNPLDNQVGIQGKIMTPKRSDSMNKADVGTSELDDGWGW